jgi:hypothetical protein
MNVDIAITIFIRDMYCRRDNMAKYRKKPVVIEAMKWTGSNVVDMEKFASTKVEYTLDNCLIVDTLEGTMKANIGDYIIKGIQGEFYPCKSDIFEVTYESTDKKKKDALLDYVKELENYLTNNNIKLPPNREDVKGLLVYE